ncbi:MAG: hypothetical protein RLZZ292_2236, partial [Bacteroidota bacterium]
IYDNVPQQIASTDLNLFTGQLADNETGELLYITPCTLIELVNVDWESQPNRVQRGLMRVRVHVIDETNYEGDERVIGAYINHSEREQAHYKALQLKAMSLGKLPGMSALIGTPSDVPILSNLNRSRTLYDHNIGPFLHTILEFTCYVYDYSAQPETISALINPEANVELVASLDGIVWQ